MDNSFDLFDDEDFSIEPKTDDHDKVKLPEISIEGEINQQASDKLSYPCVVLHGIKTQEELGFLIDRKSDEEKAIPLYINFDGMIKRFNSIELNLSLVLILRRLGSYKLDMYDKAGVCKEILLSDDENLLQFISI